MKPEIKLQLKQIFIFFVFSIAVSCITNLWWYYNPNQF